jgi:hypothetical protein
MSTERAVKENADKLLQDILRIQITNQRWSIITTPSLLEGEGG